MGSERYKLLALNLLYHRSFSWDLENPVTFRVPLYPLFIALLYSLFGINDKIVMLVQLLLSTVSIYLVYLIGKRCFNLLTGVIASSLLALDFSSILYSTLFMKDTLFAFSLLVGIYIFLKNRHPLSGFILGLSALIWSISLYLFIPFMFFQRSLKRGVLFLFLFFVPIFLWMCRNYKLYKVFSLTSLQGYHLVLCASWLEANENNIKIEDAWKKLTSSLPDTLSNPFILSSSVQKIGWSRIMKNPWKYLCLHLKGSFQMLFGVKADEIILKLAKIEGKPSTRVKEIIKNKKTSGWLKWGIFCFAIIEVSIIFITLGLAIINLVRFPSFPTLLLFSVSFYFFLLGGGVLTNSRFRIPFIPYLYLIGANLVSKKWNKEDQFLVDSQRRGKNFSSVFKFFSFCSRVFNLL